MHLKVKMSAFAHKNGRCACCTFMVLILKLMETKIMNKNISSIIIKIINLKTLAYSLNAFICEQR